MAATLEGLKVPKRQKKRGRLYLNDGSCIRLRPYWPNHVWSYDFVAERLANGQPIRMLTVIDEYTRKCLAIRVELRPMAPSRPSSRTRSMTTIMKVLVMAVHFEDQHGLY